MKKWESKREKLRMKKWERKRERNEGRYSKSESKNEIKSITRKMMEWRK